MICGLRYSRGVALLVILGVFLLSCSRSNNPPPTNTAPAQNANTAQRPGPPPDPPGGPIYGFHDLADCETIYGWAWDRTKPDAAINVDIYDGDKLLATAPANQFRQDLFDQGIGNGFHGFIYAVPANLKDGRAHSIKVKISGGSTELFGTPKEITCR
jgi:hypothetical protein